MNITDFLDYFDVIEVSDRTWPAVCNLVHPKQTTLDAIPHWPMAARKSSGRVGSGRGITERAALESGLGSAFELASTCRWPDLNTVRARANELSGIVWGPRMLCGFSDSQLSELEKHNELLAGLDEIVSPTTDEIEWITATGLDGQPVWLPADLVYINDTRSEAFATADTNGCAAGQTPEQARSAALFELIERDATGRWWYGCRSRSAIDPVELGSEVASFFDRCQRASMDPVLVDITTDLEVPTVAAIAWSDAGHAAFGFASAATYPDAALSALCEMAQMFLVVCRGDNGAWARPGLARWVSEVSRETAPMSLVSLQAKPPKAAPRKIGSRLSDANVRVAFVDLSRPEFGVPVWRAVSPDLCHWKPRFGRRRLSQPDPFDIASAATDLNDVLLRL